MLSLLATIIVIATSIINVSSDCVSKRVTFGKIFDTIITPYTNQLLTNSARWNSYVSVAASILTSPQQTEYLTLITKIRTVTPSNETQVIYEIASAILAGTLNIDTIRYYSQVYLAISRDETLNVELSVALDALATLLNTDCGISLDLDSDIYSAAATEIAKIEENILSIVPLSTIESFESEVNTLVTQLSDTALAVGVKVLSKIIASLGLTEFWSAISTTFLLPAYQPYLINLGNAFKTGTGIVDAIDDLLRTLLSKDFFLDLSDLLSASDLGELLAALLKVVLALVYDVLLIVEGLLLAVLQLLNDLLGVLGGLLGGLLGPL